MVVGYPILRRLAGSWMLHRILSLLGRPSSDAGPNLKPGSVPEFDRPRHLSFHHPVPAGLKSQGTISSKSRSLMTVSPERPEVLDRKSTRLNSSHVSISYAVYCLKKKT